MKIFYKGQDVSQEIQLVNGNADLSLNFHAQVVHCKPTGFGFENLILIGHLNQGQITILEPDYEVRT